MHFLAALALSSAMGDGIRPENLRATIEHLAAFPTRNTNTPELTKAADWIASQYRAIPGMQVEIMHYQVRKMPRVPEDRDVVEVVATLQPNQPEVTGTLLMGGHFDTINMTPSADPMTARAPGANDDASGVAATLEVAKEMAKLPRKHKMVFVAFSGEEQNLLGSAALAARAKQENWPLIGLFNNDIVGSSKNLHGGRDNRHIRVFSEDSLKHSGRELARFIEWAQRTQGERGFGVSLVFRRDRFGRGGDHTSFNNEGFTAVRFTEPNEEYSRQHSEQDLPEFVDYDYLSKVARTNLTGLRSLTLAAPAPTLVRVDRKQSYDTTVTWKSTTGTEYTVFWRLTSSPVWTGWKQVGAVDHITLKEVNKDHCIVAVAAKGGIPVPAE